MQFQTGTLTKCLGGGHYELPITIAGVTRTLQVTKDEIEFEPPSSIEEARKEIVQRLTSAVKEANAVTFAQAVTAVSSKTFKV